MTTLLPEALYALPSILDPIELELLFPSAQPLEVELGCGDGSFLIDYAKKHPERNFIGVERLWGRLQKVGRKSRRHALGNVRGIRIESAYFLQYLLPPHSAGAVHLYFPDPWPKRKHRRHRLVNEGFPRLAHRALIAGGFVHLRTDDADYFAQMLEVFSASPLFQRSEAPEELTSVLTDFEKEFQARGVPTLRATYQAATAQSLTDRDAGGTAGIAQVL
jgi:tRNA (guanine-N7-)-methyltransferase